MDYLRVPQNLHMMKHLSVSTQSTGRRSALFHVDSLADFVILPIPGSTTPCSDSPILTFSEPPLKLSTNPPVKLSHHARRGNKLQKKRPAPNRRRHYAKDHAEKPRTQAEEYSATHVADRRPAGKSRLGPRLLELFLCNVAGSIPYDMQYDDKWKTSTRKRVCASTNPFVNSTS